MHVPDRQRIEGERTGSRGAHSNLTNGSAALIRGHALALSVECIAEVVGIAHACVLEVSALIAMSAMASRTWALDLRTARDVVLRPDNGVARSVDVKPIEAPACAICKRSPTK